MQQISKRIRWTTLLLLLLAALSLFASLAVAESPAKASKLSLNKKNVTLYVTTVDQDPVTTKHTAQLTPKITPLLAAQRVIAENLISYTSSKPALVSVDPVTGKLIAHGTGNAVITCRLLDGSNKKAICYVKVKALKPTSVSLDCGKQIQMEKGTKVRVFETVLPDTVKNKGVKFTSSNRSVATISSNGTLTAKKKGTARITVRTKSGCKTASVKVKVVNGKASPDTQYRFYGIGNSNYKGWDADLPGCKNDLTYMNRALSYGKFGGKRVSRVIKRDITAKGILNFVSAIAKNKAIDENDVTIFYYTGHGDYDGSLIGTNFARVRVSEIKCLLDKVPGTVIVMLDSCYSGQFIQSKGASLSPKRLALGATQFSSSWVSALKEGKGGSSLAASKSLIDPYTANGQYKILTACAPDETSLVLTYPNAPDALTNLSFFTTGLYNGIRLDGATPMAADADGDGTVTVNELFVFSRDTVDGLLDTIYKTYGLRYEQTIMIYPAGDSTPVFQVD